VEPDDHGGLRGADVVAAAERLLGRAAAVPAGGAGAHAAVRRAVFAAPAGHADPAADHRKRDPGLLDHPHRPGDLRPTFDGADAHRTAAVPTADRTAPNAATAAAT
jgi:hypothetical protein